MDDDKTKVEQEEIAEEPEVPTLPYARLCDFDGDDGSAECLEPATREFIYRDEEGDVYITQRCEAHPEEDPDYEEREL